MGHKLSKFGERLAEFVELLLDFGHFIWRRNSNSATTVCIDMAQYMTPHDRNAMIDYFEALNEYGK